MKRENKLLEELREVIAKLDVSTISEERKEVLQPLIHYIQNKVDVKVDVRLNFICTHNSRRSHLAQVWAQTMARHYVIRYVHCYSGGTEATAVYPKVIETLENTGFKTAAISDGDNPVYAIKFANSAHPIIGFSKVYDHRFNPDDKFAAVMVCSHADENCPFVAGTEKRIAITYEDPKAFDGTDQQAEKYYERSLQIATEMKYVFSKIKY